MSEGRFTRSRYEANDGDIHPIRVQPETLTATVGGAANAAPTGAVDNSISAKVSRGNRGFGLRPRFVTFAWNEGAAPSGYDDRTLQRLPILTESVWDGIEVNDPVSYLGGTGVVVSKSPESIR